MSDTKVEPGPHIAVREDDAVADGIEQAYVADYLTGKETPIDCHDMPIRNF
jgi:hypothetical protein